MSILGSIPIIGSVFGGDSSSGGLLGGIGSIMPNLGIEHMFIELVVGIIVLELIFKLIGSI